MIEWLHLLKIELLREGDLVILMHVNQKHYILCLMFSLSGHLIQKLFQNIFLAHEKNPYNFNYEKKFHFTDFTKTSRRKNPSGRCSSSDSKSKLFGSDGAVFVLCNWSLLQGSPDLEGLDNVHRLSSLTRFYWLSPWQAWISFSWLLSSSLLIFLPLTQHQLVPVVVLVPPKDQLSVSPLNYGGLAYVDLKKNLKSFVKQGAGRLA